jgi:hypothetical protein
VPKFVATGEYSFPPQIHREHAAVRTLLELFVTATLRSLTRVSHMFALVGKGP